MKTFILVFSLLYVTFLSVFSQSVTITIDPTKTSQTIFGFGGKSQMTSNYDTYLRYIVDLMGMSVSRHEMHGGDASSVDQINARTVPFTDGDEYANYYKALKAKGVTNIVATSWSPPACLKTNNSIIQGGSLKSEYYDEYGKFLADWVKDFETKTTQKIYAFNIQNEPLFYEPYASCILPAQEFAPCLQKVKTEFTSAGLTTKFHGPEHMLGYSRNSGGDGTGSRYIQTLLWNATYRPLLDIYSVHGYTNGVVADAGNDGSWYPLDTAVRKWGKDLWLSETEFAETATWDLALNISKAIYAALKSGKANAWIYWGLDGNNGMFTGGSATPRLYAVMHYARFIRPGYIQVESNDDDKDIATITFKNGSDYTVVIINSNASSKVISLNNFTNKPSYFHFYRSSATEQCAYIGKIENNEFQLLPKSIATLYYKASEPDVVYGPSAPQNLQATVIEDDKITVTWSPTAAWTLAGSPVSISGYVVYINGVKKTPDGPTTKTTWTFTGLKKNTVYKIEIYSRDAMINQSTASAINVVTTCSTNDCGPAPDPDPDPISIEESNSSFIVSPNPVLENLSLHLPDNQLYQIQIINASGQIVNTYANISDAAVIDVKHLSAGIYFITASNQMKILKTKILKID